TLRIASVLAARCGLATALPPEGGALRLWASRWLAVRDGRRDAARALIRAAPSPLDVLVYAVWVRARVPLSGSANGGARPVLPRARAGLSRQEPPCRA